LTGRLQKIISSHGVASRRAAEKLISEGKVTVNGRVAFLGMTADDEKDRIVVCGKPLGQRQKPVYIALNKPEGYVTTRSDEKGRRTVMDLLSSCPFRVYPVGRLDFNSRGLLLLTNDGEFANMMMHPSHLKEKVYHVRVRGDVSGETVLRLGMPMDIDGYIIKPVKVEVLSRSDKSAKLEFRLTEGRNRQIRKMCEKAGLTVQRLERVSYGGIKLGGLNPGCWRYLTEDEIRCLKKEI
jgi:23S rRNA pseudouridine2605 synthase